MSFHQETPNRFFFGGGNRKITKIVKLLVLEVFGYETRPFHLTLLYSQLKKRHRCKQACTMLIHLHSKVLELSFRSEPELCTQKRVFNAQAGATGDQRKLMLADISKGVEDW
jgi:hypothetical protein